MISWTAVARVSALRTSRSPLLLATLLGFGGLLASFPPLSGLAAHAAVRQGFSYVVQASVLALGATAVLLATRRSDFDGAPALRLCGPRATCAGDLLGLLLTTTALAGAAGFLGYAYIRAAVVDPGRPTTTASIRETVWRNETALRAEQDSTIDFVVRPGGATSGAVQLEMTPRLRRASADSTSSAPVSASDVVEVRYRADGGRWRSNDAAVRRARLLQLALVYRDDGRPASRVEIRIAPPPGRVLEIPADGLYVLGARTPPMAALLRGCLAAAFGALAAAAIVRMFSGFCALPLAVAAAVTVAFAAFVLRDLPSAPAWLRTGVQVLPGGGAFDPAEALLLGRDVPWGAVSIAAAKAGAACLFAVVAAVRPRGPAR